MNVVKAENATVTVQLSVQEVGIINDALNEVSSGIDLAEFGTSMGVSRDEVTDLLSQFGRLL